MGRVKEEGEHTSSRSERRGETAEHHGRSPECGRWSPSHFDQGFQRPDRRAWRLGRSCETFGRKCEKFDRNCERVGDKYERRGSNRDRLGDNGERFDDKHQPLEEKREPFDPSAERARDIAYGRESFDDAR